MKNLQKIGYVAMVSLIFLLCGCSTNGAELEKAIGFCEQNGGIKRISADRFVGIISAECNNGATFRIEKINT